MSSPSGPIRLAVLNDYELVVRGLARMLEPFADRIHVVELDSRLPVASEVDVALVDTYPLPTPDSGDLERILRSPAVRRTVLYTWMLTPDLVAHAREHRLDAAISKGASAVELVAAIERVHSGESTLQPFDEEQRNAGVWPGRSEGLTARESEIIALITDGLSNQEIATRSYLSINSVKSYIRTAYRTMGVTSRSQAVLWGIDHGFARSRARISLAAHGDAAEDAQPSR